MALGLHLQSLLGPVRQDRIHLHGLLEAELLALEVLLQGHQGPARVAGGTPDAFRAEPAQKPQGGLVGERVLAQDPGGGQEGDGRGQVVGPELVGLFLGPLLVRNSLVQGTILSFSPRPDSVAARTTRSMDS